MKMQFPLFQSLGPLDVERIIDDLEFQREGAKLYFAVDPYEVVDFCFPISHVGSNALDIDTVADDQLALYEIFWLWPQKPVLLLEYAKELQGLSYFFNNNLDLVYSRSEMLEEIIRAGELTQLSTEAEKALAIVESDFHIILAIVMGIYSLGTERFLSVFRDRLQVGILETNYHKDKLTIKRIMDDYVETALAETIFNGLQKSYREHRESNIERIRRQRVDLTDARAVDRLIYLNSALEDAYRRGYLETRHILLYLSSASRTKTIFNMPDVQKALPKIGNNKYAFWRTRRQVFTYVVNKSEKVEETIGKLMNLKDVLVAVQNLDKSIYSTANCEECVVEGSVSLECPLFTFCTEIQKLYKEIHERRVEIENLGLVNAISNYQRLLAAQPSSVSHRSYLELFAEVSRSGIKDIAMERMHQKQQWILIKSETASLFGETLNEAREKQVNTGFRSNKDFVISIDQYLPSKPKLKSTRNKEIINSILAYYKQPTHFDLLEKAYENYTQLALDIDRRDPELELIRCYLYLAFSKAEGEEKAYNYVKQLIGNDNLSQLDPLIEREYRYVLCWVARRMGRFEEADECARIAISKWSEDPRFYHGRSLNIYAWLSQANSPSSCIYTLRDAIVDAQRAIELYQQDEDSNKDVIAGNYNNLTYFYALEVAKNQNSIKEAQEILTEARLALKKLKDLVPKDTWTPNHPEYFHAEAYLAYQEFLVDMSKGNVKEYLGQKLIQAKHDIDMALHLYVDSSDYYELRESIERGLNMITGYKPTN
jgi:hypothetical protein